MKKTKERITSQKRIILEYLRGVKNHPSAEMVFQAVQRQLPQISLATVYRNLKSLKEKGVIQEVPDKISRYDGDISSHAHFICEKCEQIFDVFEKCSIANNPQKIKVGKITSYKIYLYGKCKKCAK